MDHTSRNIFKAIHEGKWLSIEYRNKKDEVTKYWVAILNINISRRSLHVEGFHLSKFTVDDYPCIYIDSILTSAVVEGSYYEPPAGLLADIDENPEKYEGLFHRCV